MWLSCKRMLRNTVGGDSVDCFLPDRPAVNKSVSQQWTSTVLLVPCHVGQLLTHSDCHSLHEARLWLGLKLRVFLRRTMLLQWAHWPRPYLSLCNPLKCWPYQHSCDEGESFAMVPWPLLPVASSLIRNSSIENSVEEIFKAASTHVWDIPSKGCTRPVCVGQG